MKQHTADFKNEIKEQGRRLSGIITYNNTTLRDEIYKINPHFKASILKSVMKELELELSVDIPIGTEINCKIGILVNGSYEYMDYGNYIVNKSEKQEDKELYVIKCYDKMLYSMKEYEELNVTYPISIKNFLIAIANKIGLQVENTNFENQNLEIQNDLYTGLNYTYRDILDEIAQATGSIICINENDKIEVKYPTETNDTINEYYLKDTNVNFGKKYGPINVIVLSRSAESDNIYYPNVLPENPCEIKIVDNQIMNFNDRSDYMPGIYNALNGLEYYVTDFESTGILYYDVGDLYNVSIKGNTYKCLMLEDEIEVTTGIKELISAEMPEQGETDYTKADKTDRKINQTNLIVNKQEQQIQGIVTQIGDRSEKQTTITQDIDGINAKVEDLEDLTENAEGLREIELQNCVTGPLLELHIYGNNTVFDYLFPRDDLYPSNTLYPHGDSRIIVTDKDGNSKIYELAIMDVLRQNGTVYDEYVLENGIAKVIRRINKDGTIKIQEEIETIGEYSIDLSEGTNTIRIQNYNARIKAKFAIQNDYTEIFATKVEMSSSITQTAEEINLEVRKKVDENKVISKINQSAEQVSIEANKISLSGKTLNLADNMAIVSNNFNVDSNGNMTCSNATFKEGNITLQGAENKFNAESPVDKNIYTSIYTTERSAFININATSQNRIGLSAGTSDGGYSTLTVEGPDSNINCWDGTVSAMRFEQVSKETQKKNIKKFAKGLDIINQIDIYEFNYKNEKNEDKKHIGFIIGDNYNYSKRATSNNNNSVDLYSFISVCCKAIQEQQEEIEELQNKIKEMEGKNGQD